MSDLGGKRVVVTRPTAQAVSMCRALEQQNARPILFPTVQIVAFENNTRLQQAFSDWDSFDWVVFTSVNGVNIFYDAAMAAGFVLRQRSGRPSLGAIGPATAGALEARGSIVRCVPDEYVAEEIVRTLGEVEGQRILLPRAKKARKVLTDQLRERGAEVVDVATYDVVDPTPTPDAGVLLSGGVDAITFTSSSTVEGLLHMLGERAKPILDQSCVACIGPVTADTARRNGIRVDVVATDYTTNGLIQALVRHYAS